VPLTKKKSLGGERRKVSKGGEPSEVTPNKLGNAVEFFNNNYISESRERRIDEFIRDISPGRSTF
jgi:hypothetical protein